MTSATPEDDGASLTGAARIGLWRGDLKPLAALLRSGLEIPWDLRRDLATCIDNEAAYYRIVTLKQRNAPPLDFMEAVSARDRLIRIGYYVESRTSQGRFESTVTEATEKFGVSRKTVTKALKRYRGWVAEGRVRDGSWIVGGGIMIPTKPDAD